MPHTRTRTLKIEKSKLAERAIKFYDDDTTNRSAEMTLRANRYAKYRQWRTDSPTQPWAGAADAALGDMLRASLRMQDTLYNAITGTRPILNPKATSEASEGQEDNLEKILDYQAFVENGETWASDLVDNYVNDGHYTAFIPWVEEKRHASTIKIFPKMPEEFTPQQYFEGILNIEFPKELVVPASNPWDYFSVEVDEQGNPMGEETSIAFYTDPDEQIEMVVTKKLTRFAGPKIIIKDRADVLHPVRVDNLQAPGPSNPAGASHVILVSRPSFDEIRRLKESGFYDLLTSAQIKTIDKRADDSEEHLTQEQKDIIAGETKHGAAPPVEHEDLTLLHVFDVVDIEGNGKTEDIVYWVLKSSKLVLRVRRMSEMYPSRIPKRPFAEASMIPVPGRRTGIGMLELTEAMHDIQKQILDQAIDHGTMMLTPFGFYRPTSSMRPEMVSLAPGELYPLADPRNDVNFPSLPSAGQAFALNMLTYLQQQQETDTMIGQFQFGRVPRGKASALRTASAVSQISAQGDARPERILRRMFHGLAGIFQIMHELNIHFLDKKKAFRIATSIKQNESPYREISNEDINGFFDFEFKANAFNTSKQLLQDSLGQLLGMYLNPIAIQLGIVEPVGIYNAYKDMTKALGADPDRYLVPPAQLPALTAEEAVIQVMSGQVPFGVPREPPEQHLKLLEMFVQSDEFAFLDEEMQQALIQWAQSVGQFMQQQQQRSELAAQAEGGGPEGGGEEGAAPDNSQAPLEENELQDESLPSSGGGASE